jgi:hypothetical protein
MSGRAGERESGRAGERESGRFVTIKTFVVYNISFSMVV